MNCIDNYILDQTAELNLDERTDGDSSIDYDYSQLSAETVSNKNS